MKRHWTIATVVAAILATALASPAGAQTTPGEAPAAVREALPNDFSIELLGRSLLYNFSYQRMLNAHLGLEAGAAALGGGSISGDEGGTLMFASAGARYYFMHKDGSPFVTGGGVLASLSTDAGPFGDNSTGSYGFAGAGLEWRFPSGMMFRGTAYGLIAEGGFFIWPGLTVGYAF